MPVVRFTAEEANRNLRRNRVSMWPDGRVPTDRLSDVIKVSFTPSFTFSRKDRILTIGSCFAREIEHRLETLGFDLPMTQVSIPQEERYTKTANDIISKFTVQSMENELNWSLGETEPPPPEKLFLEVGDGLWHDPQLVNNTHPGSMERVIERRAMVQAAVAQAPSCRVVIITLGLAEAWFDQETSLYLNTAPPQPALKRYPGRFSLDVLSYEDIFSSLERIHALLQRRGHPDFKVLITVSPVPFKATFSGQDAIVANSYSKAVQRAACQAFVQRHDNVDYFPSFEIVTMSNRELVYERDNLHIGQSVVSTIVDQVLTNYSPDVEFTRTKVGLPKTRRSDVENKHYDLFVLAKHYAEEGQHDKAVETCRTLLAQYYDQMSDRDRSATHIAFGSILTKTGRWAEAAAQLELAVKLSPNEVDAWHKLGKAYSRTGRRREAISALTRAVEISPKDPDLIRSLANARGWLGVGDVIRSGIRRLTGARRRKPAPQPPRPAFNVPAVEAKPGPVSAAAKHTAERLWEKSVAAFKQRNYRRSADLMQTLLKDCGEEAGPAGGAHTRLSLGITLLRLKQTEPGVAELKRAVELDPNVGRAWQKLGAGLARLRRRDEALECFQRALALEPTDPDVQWRLGEELRRLERPAEALKALKRCLKLAPDHAPARRSIGEIEKVPDLPWNVKLTLRLMRA